MPMNRKPVILLAALAVALGTLFTSSAAFAAPAGHSAPATIHPIAKPKLNQGGMYVAGFNSAVNKAHGYKIVTYANGDQQSVPINPNSRLPKSQILHRSSHGMVAATNTDYNQVGGNCGISWIRVSQTGTNKVAVASGYKNLAGPAYYWSWNVSLSDKNGTSHQTYAGATSGEAASRIWSNLNQYGFTFDYVYSGGAVLDDGTICLSGAPDVSINL
jgi:hypothetical protein